MSANPGGDDAPPTRTKQPDLVPGSDTEASDKNEAQKQANRADLHRRHMEMHRERLKNFYRPQNFRTTPAATSGDPAPDAEAEGAAAGAGAGAKAAPAAAGKKAPVAAAAAGGTAKAGAKAPAGAGAGTGAGAGGDVNDDDEEGSGDDEPSTSSGKKKKNKKKNKKKEIIKVYGTDVDAICGDNSGLWRIAEASGAAPNVDIPITDGKLRLERDNAFKGLVARYETDRPIIVDQNNGEKVPGNPGYMLVAVLKNDLAYFDNKRVSEEIVNLSAIALSDLLLFAGMRNNLDAITTILTKRKHYSKPKTIIRPCVMHYAISQRRTELFKALLDVCKGTADAGFHPLIRSNWTYDFPEDFTSINQMGAVLGQVERAAVPNQSRCLLHYLMEQAIPNGNEAQQWAYQAVRLIHERMGSNDFVMDEERPATGDKTVKRTALQMAVEKDKTELATLIIGELNAASRSRELDKKYNWANDESYTLLEYASEVKNNEELTCFLLSHTTRLTPNGLNALLTAMARPRVLAAVVNKKLYDAEKLVQMCMDNDWWELLGGMLETLPPDVKLAQFQVLPAIAGPIEKASAFIGLMKRDAKVKTDVAKTPIAFALENGNIQVIEFYLRFMNMDPRAPQTPQKDNILHLACKTTKSVPALKCIVDFLLERDMADLLTTPNGERQKPADILKRTPQLKAVIDVALEKLEEQRTESARALQRAENDARKAAEKAERKAAKVKMAEDAQASKVALPEPSARPVEETPEVQRARVANFIQGLRDGAIQLREIQTEFEKVTDFMPKPAKEAPKAEVEVEGKGKGEATTDAPVVAVVAAPQLEPFEYNPESDEEDKNLSVSDLPWEIVITKQAKRQWEQLDRPYRERVGRRLRLLAEGRWTPTVAKPLQQPGLNLFESKFSKGGRIIWELALDFSQRLSEAAIDQFVYVEVVRVWNVLLDHDAVPTAIKNIHNSHFRSEHAQVKRHLVTYDRKNIPNAAPQIDVNADGTKVTTPKLYRILNGQGVKVGIANNNDFMALREMVDANAQIQVDKTNPNMRTHYPPAAAVEDTYTLEKFYTVSQQMLSTLVEVGSNTELSSKRFKNENELTTDYQFRVSEVEHAIIKLNPQPPTSLMLLGRSGTGKTTCALFRMFGNYQAYWQSNPDENFLLSGPYPELTPLSSHMHQVFITANPVLRSEVKRSFWSLQRGVGKSTSNAQASLPPTLNGVPEECFPLFLTSREWLLMLDGTLKKPFFPRDPVSGAVTAKGIVESDNTEEARVVALPEYDSDWSDDEDIFGRDQRRDNQREDKGSYTYVEIDYNLFSTAVWRDINSNGMCTFHPSLVFTEIFSFIKGTTEAMDTAEGCLSYEQYEEIGKKRAATFSREDRRMIYDMFEKYEKFKKGKRHEKRYFDMMDVVHHVFKGLGTDIYRGTPIHSIVHDEVQDFTQAELKIDFLVCTDPNKLFFTGDSCQTIARGVGFRFQDLRTIFHQEAETPREVRPLQNPNTKVQVPEIYQLRENYRAHSGILNLAASVVELLETFFPLSLDKLQRDQGIFEGPQPLLLTSAERKELILLLHGTEESSSDIEFGAHQVVIVRNQESKKNLPPELRMALVLTVFEAKGLEFDDVLLYNFFSDSQADKEWRIVTKYQDDYEIKYGKTPAPEQKSGDDSLASAVGVERIDLDKEQVRPRPLEFNELEHKILMSELKFLYTALTRARVNLWIYDENVHKRAPMFDYLQRRRLVSIVDKMFDGGAGSNAAAPRVRGLAVRSSKEEWYAVGNTLFRLAIFDVAADCYEKAGQKDLMTRAFAYHLANQANDSDKYERKKKYLSAADFFLRVSLTSEAARCLHGAEEYALAAQLFELRKEYKQAAREYMKAGLDAETGAMLDLSGNHKHTVDFHVKAKEYRRAMEFIDKQQVDPKTLKMSLDRYLLGAAEESLRANQREAMMGYLTRLSNKDSMTVFLRTNQCPELATIMQTSGKFQDALDYLCQNNQLAEAARLCTKEGSRDQLARVLIKYTRNTDFAAFSQIEREERERREMESTIRSITRTEDENGDLHTAMLCEEYGRKEKRVLLLNKAKRMYDGLNHHFGAARVQQSVIELEQGSLDKASAQDLEVLLNSWSKAADSLGRNGSAVEREQIFAHVGVITAGTNSWYNELSIDFKEYLERNSDVMGRVSKKRTDANLSRTPVTTVDATLVILREIGNIVRGLVARVPTLVRATLDRLDNTASCPQHMHELPCENDCPPERHVMPTEDSARGRLIELENNISIVYYTTKLIERHSDVIYVKKGKVEPEKLDTTPLIVSLVTALEDELFPAHPELMPRNVRTNFLDHISETVHGVVPTYIKEVVSGAMRDFIADPDVCMRVWNILEHIERKPEQLEQLMKPLINNPKLSPEDAITIEGKKQPRVMALLSAWRVMQIAKDLPAAGIFEATFVQEPLARNVHGDSKLPSTANCLTIIERHLPLMIPLMTEARHPSFLIPSSMFNQHYSKTALRTNLARTWYTHTPVNVKRAQAFVQSALHLLDKYQPWPDKQPQILAQVERVAIVFFTLLLNHSTQGSLPQGFLYLIQQALQKFMLSKDDIPERTRRLITMILGQADVPAAKLLIEVNALLARRGDEFLNVELDVSAKRPNLLPRPATDKDVAGGANITLNVTSAAAGSVASISDAVVMMASEEQAAVYTELSPEIKQLTRKSAARRIQRAFRAHLRDIRAKIDEERTFLQAKSAGKVAGCPYCGVWWNAASFTDAHSREEKHKRNVRAYNDFFAVWDDDVRHQIERYDALTASISEGKVSTAIVRDAQIMLQLAEVSSQNIHQIIAEVRRTCAWDAEQLRKNGEQLRGGLDDIEGVIGNRGAAEEAIADGDDEPIDWQKIEGRKKIGRRRGAEDDDGDAPVTGAAALSSQALARKRRAARKQREAENAAGVGPSGAGAAVPTSPDAPGPAPKTAAAAAPAPAPSAAAQAPATQAPAKKAAGGGNNNQGGGGGGKKKGKGRR